MRRLGVLILAILLTITGWSQTPQALIATDAELYNGAQFQFISGDSVVGYLNTGAYFVWRDIDFGSGVDSVDIRLVAHPEYLSQFIVTIDDLVGNTILTYTPTSTGDWYTYEIQSYAVNDVSGVHDIYVQSTGPAAGNIHWMSFYGATVVDPDPDVGHVTLRESNNIIEESIHDASFSNSQYIKRQFFMAEDDYTITEVRTLMYRLGDPNCTINVAVYKVQDSINLIGDPISTGSIESSVLLTEPNNWVSIDMTHDSIKRGEHYCIDVTVTDIADPNRVYWQANTDVKLDQYLMYSYDGGVTINGPILSNDYMFEMYGFSGPDTRQDVGILWNASTDNVGVAGYNIWVDALYFDNCVDTTYTLKLNPGTYVVAVSAFDAAGNESDKSESIVITIGPPDIDPPTPPEDLMEIVPNPAIAAFNVYLKRALVENSKFQILSPTGQIIFERDIVPGETAFVVDEDLLSGIYVLALIENGKRVDNTHLVIV
jgi:hypothetical protein